MKTSAKTLIALAFTAIIMSTSGFVNQAVASEKAPSSVDKTLKFNKIVVTGNVNVTLVQKAKTDVKSYGYDDTMPTVVQKGYTLYITGAEDAKADVTISVADLVRIEAYNGAHVRTVGNFDLNVLQIFLKDDATANVKGDIASLYTVIKDQADLKLSGTSKKYVMEKNDTATLNTQNFAAVRTETHSLDNMVAVNIR